MGQTFALPFKLKRSSDVFGMTSMTTTTETVHGLLRLEEDEVVIQWRLARKIDHLGGTEMRTDEEMESVVEVVVPLAAVAGSFVRRRRWWDFWRGPKIVIKGADLQAFDVVAGQGALKLKHPAELVLGLRGKDLLLGEEFSAELELAVAKLQLRRSEERRALGSGGDSAGQL